MFSNKFLIGVSVLFSLNVNTQQWYQYDIAFPLATEVLRYLVIFFSFLRYCSICPQNRAKNRRKRKTSRNFVQNRNKVLTNKLWQSSESLFLLLIFIRRNLFYFSKFFLCSAVFFSQPTVASHVDVLRLVTRSSPTRDKPKNVCVGG